MESEWAGGKDFVQSLSAIKASKSPISASKIQIIAQTAFNDLKVRNKQSLFSLFLLFIIYLFFVYLIC